MLVIYEKKIFLRFSTSPKDLDHWITSQSVGGSEMHGQVYM